MDRLHVLSVIGLVAFASGALLALLDGRVVLAGTLLVFTAFAIYLREITKQESTG